MLCLDWETQDGPMGRGFGAGWVFNLNHNDESFKLLGASVKSEFDSVTEYVTDIESLKMHVLNHDTLIMHNAMYDLGCLLVLFKGDNRFKVENYTIYDTLIMAKLADQSRYNYSLDSLGKDYKLAATKESEILHDYAWDSGLYQASILEVRGINSVTRPSPAVLEKWCKTHMDKFPHEVVGPYANLDVDTTWELYHHLLPKLKYLDLSFYSDLIKLTVEIKAKGINVDLHKAKTNFLYLGEAAAKQKQEIFRNVGHEFNINSPMQVVAALQECGITDFPKTAKGADSIAGGWLEEQDHPICRLLAEYRETTKIKDQFIKKLIEYQEITGMADQDIGIMYPTFKIMGAVKTGRFSSGSGDSKSFELNMQQIPARNPVLGALCRSLFIPPKGMKWLTADYSNQEQRLQVHYAALWKMPGVESVVKAWNDDPNLDYHLKVAEIVGFLCTSSCGSCPTCKAGRTKAKTINLGLSYGMGQGKLCKQLGLPTTWWQAPSGMNVEVAGPEGKLILDSYRQLLPFMHNLQTSAAEMLVNRGFVESMGGRRIDRDPPHVDPRGRNGLNKLIQGSAADQTMKALVNCYKAGLDVRCTVHDEICIVSCNPEQDMLTLNKSMVEAYPTLVPMVADVGIGDTWGDSK